MGGKSQSAAQPRLGGGMGGGLGGARNTRPSLSMGGGMPSRPQAMAGALMQQQPSSGLGSQAPMPSFGSYSPGAQAGGMLGSAMPQMGTIGGQLGGSSYGAPSPPAFGAMGSATPWGGTFGAPMQGTDLGAMQGAMQSAQNAPAAPDANAAAQQMNAQRMQVPQPPTTGRFGQNPLK